METTKFKVGDKVRVRSLEWYNKEKNENGEIVKGRIFVEEMSQFCNKILTIKDIYVDFYLVEENSNNWQDWMFENEIIKDIKKRILTKEVAQAVVRCSKYILKNKDENANLQKKLFEIGCKWASGSENLMYEDCKYLYVNQNLIITMGEVGEADFYRKIPSAELEVNDVLNIEIKDITMETKEMTQQEIYEYLGSTKILCKSTEESTKVQEKLFELGIMWLSGGKIIQKENFLLFVNHKGCMTYCSDINTWMNDVNTRIEPNEILAIQLKEEKQKFDPSNLEDFQKVLVRNDDGEFWCLDFYDSYRFDDEAEREMFYCISGLYMQCVPYNEETKHLKGTTKEAPALYRI